MNVKYFKSKTGANSSSLHYLCLSYDVDGQRISGSYSYRPFSSSDVILPNISLKEGSFYQEILPDELPDSLKILWDVEPQVVTTGGYGDERDFQKYNIS